MTRAERVLLGLLAALILFSPIFLGGVRGFEKEGGAEPTLLEGFLWAEGPWWIHVVLAAGIAAAALVVAAERAAAGEPEVRRLHPLLVLPFGGLVLLAVLQYGTITVSPEGTRRALAGLFVGGAVLLGSLLAARRPAAALVLVGAVAAAFTGSAAYGLFETWFGGDTVLGFSKGAGKGVTGTFLNRSNMAAGAGLAIPLVIVLLRRAPWLLAALGVLLVAVPLTNSRMGFLAAAAGLVALGLLAARAVRWPAWAKGLLVLGAVATAGAGTWIAVDRLPGLRERFAQGITPTGFFDIRFPAWRSTLALAARYPILGTGLGSYEVAIHETQTAENPDELVHAHSEPLEALAEGGLLGLALAVLLLAGAVSACLRAAAAEDRLVRSAGCACGGALAALLVGCLVEFHLHVPALGIAALVLAGVPAALAAGEPRSAPAGGTVKGIAAAAVGLAVLAAFLGTAAAARHGAIVRADLRKDGSRLLLPGTPEDAASWRSLAMALADAGRGDEALAAAEEAVALEPFNAYGHWTRAVALLAAGRPPAEAAAAIDRALSRAGGIGHLHLAAGSVLLELSVADPSLRPGALAALREAGMILPQNFSVAWGLALRLGVPSSEWEALVPDRSHAWWSVAGYWASKNDPAREMRAWAEAQRFRAPHEDWSRNCLDAGRRAGLEDEARLLLDRIPPVTGPVLAVHQPNFAPWLGWFAKAALADHFVLLDDVQYPKGSWVNRTQLLGPSGKEYLTIPVKHPGLSPIREVRVASPDWAEKHARKLKAWYHGAPGLAAALEVLGDGREERLCGINEAVIRRACAALGIGTPLVRSSSLALGALDPTDRHIALCRKVGATTYLSGQGAAAYNDEARFKEAGIALAYLSFEHPVYDQGTEPFTPGLSVLDFLCRTGDAARERFAAAVGA